jgi:hypothetical protein
MPVENWNDKLGGGIMACDVSKRIALIALLGLAAMLAGCETLQPDAVKAQTQGKSLVVASMLGPKVKLQWIGTTVFNNEYGEISPDTWDLDGKAQTAGVDALRVTGRYARVAGVAGVQRGADGAPRLPTDTQADVVIVITQASHGDPLFGTNQGLAGLGVVQRTFMGLERTEVFSAIRLDLYDGAGKSMGSRMQFEHEPAGFKLLSGSSNKEPPKVTDADMAAFRDKLHARLRKAVETALAKAGLL